KAVVNIEGDRLEPQSDGSRSLNGKNSDETVKAYNGMGTGIIIDPRGYILTNDHVIDGIKKLKIKTYDKSEYIGVVIARSAEKDIAIIKINGKEPFYTIKFGNSDDVRWGEEVSAIGNPFGYEYTLTEGRVSNLGRDVFVHAKLTYKNAIQTSAAINPGNSGGPLLNADGETIGVCAAMHSSANGIAFALPSNQVVEVAANLLQQSEAGRSVYHGIRLKAQESQDEAIVEAVDPGSPADLAGVKPGDVIVAMGPNKIQKNLDFSLATIGQRVNSRLPLVVMRNNEELETSITLSASRRGNRNSAAASAAGNTNTGVAANNSRNQQSNRVVNQSENQKSLTVDPAERYTANRGQKPADDKSQLYNDVWESLGIRYTTMPLATYKKLYPQYSMPQKNNGPNQEADEALYPDGAIIVKSVGKGSYMEAAGVEEGDMIFGLVGLASVTIDENGVITVSDEENGLVTASDEDMKNVLVALNKTKPNKEIKVLLNRPKPCQGEPPNTLFEASFDLK
ncbi:MAG: S1C family serine protease, partial [Thermoguttaceae bacterium]